MVNYVRKTAIIFIISFLTMGLIIYIGISEKNTRYKVILMDGEVMECRKVFSYRDHTTTLIFKDHSKIIIPTNNIKVIKVLN